LHLGEGRQVLGDRIGQHDLAFFRQDHRADRGERLGHRVDAEDGVLGHRSAARGISRAERLEVCDAALARDDRHRAGKLLRLDLGLQGLADPAEPIGREADLFGARRRKRLRPGNGKREGQRNDEDAEESPHESLPRRREAPS